jgi:ribosomal protein S18 acetylase RimI-like enzyme
VTRLVRPAAAADADAVFGLLGQFATSYVPDRRRFDQHYPVLLEAADAHLLVVMVHAKVAGYVLGFQLPTLYANGVVLTIQELVVDPAYRGRGLGRTLVEALIARGQDAGAVEVTVPTRHALNFYARLGFVETATYLKRPLAAEEATFR